MKFLYDTIINALLFYFFLNVFNGIKIAGASNSLWANIIAGLLFGALIAAIPQMLKFFKLPDNLASNFLLSLIVVFIFLFILYLNVAKLGSISATKINMGSLGGEVILSNAVTTMVAATVVISLGVLGLKALARKK